MADRRAADRAQPLSGSRRRGRPTRPPAEAALIAQDEQEDTARLFLAGDVMLGRGIDQILTSPGDPINDYEGLRHVVEMGVEEGIRRSVGQMDALLAE